MNDKNVLTNLEDDLNELENQLSCPKGDLGIEVGRIMNKSNIMMTLNSIEVLDIINNSKVLEIGHGNCGHLDKILETALNIKYYGLEISETMRDEALKEHSKKDAEFHLYNGSDIPFQNNYFDRILAVNTIYFWANPKQLFLEIERTLKVNGIFVLTFAEKDYLSKLPFARDKFNIYEKRDIEDFIKTTSLKIIDFLEFCDEIPNQLGGTLLRKYIISKIKKL